MTLKLELLTKFNDEFADFFKDPEAIKDLDGVECDYSVTPLKITFSDGMQAGWLLLRNKDDTYLLVEADEQRGWETFFLRDPKKILEHVQDVAQCSWERLIPLLRTIHKAADVAEASPDERYLERMISAVYHSTDPTGAIHVLLGITPPTF